jgi:hypothetical protein
MEDLPTIHKWLDVGTGPRGTAIAPPALFPFCMVAVQAPTFQIIGEQLSRNTQHVTRPALSKTARSVGLNTKPLYYILLVHLWMKPQSN